MHVLGSVDRHSNLPLYQYVTIEEARDIALCVVPGAEEASACPGWSSGSSGVVLRNVYIS